MQEQTVRSGGVFSNNESSAAISADYEVQKLKDLVKKLERQNQHLRNKTGKLSPYLKNEATSGDFNRIASSSVDVHPAQQSNIVGDLGDSDHENEAMSWLYTSPKKQKNREDRRSLETWLRSELDHPSTPQLAMAKKSIINSLDQSPLDLLDGPKDTSEVPSSFVSSDASMADGDRNYRHRANAPSARRRSPSPKVAHRLGSKYDDENSTSPKYGIDGAPTEVHQVHHMPLPSHTMTSAHGLVPSSTIVRHRQRSPSPNSRLMKHDSSTYKYPARHRSPLSARGESPTRARNEKIPASPRSYSPASSLGYRKNFSSTGNQVPRTASPRPDSEPSPTYQRGRQGGSLLQAPGVTRSRSPRSNIASPSDSGRQRFGSPRTTKLPSRSMLVNKAPVSEAGHESYSAAQPASSLPKGPSTRRSLPRPSQTTRSQLSNHSSRHSEGSSRSNSSDIVLGQRAEGSPSLPMLSDSESGNSDVWKDGEFF